MLNLPGFVPVAETSASLADWITDAFANIAMADPHVRLFKNNFTPSPATILTDLVEADFDGYAPVAGYQAANWTASPGIMPDGSAIAFHIGGLANFLDTGNVTPNTVYGMYITTDAAGIRLLGALAFDSPKVMDDAGKFINIDVALVMPANAPALAADVTSNG
jgi:hypothetical protein